MSRLGHQGGVPVTLGETIWRLSQAESELPKRESLRSFPTAVRFPAALRNLVTFALEAAECFVLQGSQPPVIFLASSGHFVDTRGVLLRWANFRT